MDTNGTGAERDPAITTFPAVSAFVYHLITERPALAEHRESLYQLAGMAARFGYEQCREDLRRAAFPVKLGEKVETLVTLEGEEAKAVLKAFGLLPAEGDGNGHKQP